MKILHNLWLYLAIALSSLVAYLGFQSKRAYKKQVESDIELESEKLFAKALIKHAKAKEIARMEEAKIKLRREKFESKKGIKKYDANKFVVTNRTTTD